MTVNVYTYYRNRIALGEAARDAAAAAPAPVVTRRRDDLVPVGMALGVALAAGVSIATVCVHPGMLALHLASGAGLGAGLGRLGAWVSRRRRR